MLISLDGLEYIEICIILLIFLCQAYSFSKTLSKTLELEALLPKRDKLNIKNILINLSDIASTDKIQEILTRKYTVGHYHTELEDADTPNTSISELMSISTIDTTANIPSFNNLLLAINTYLIRNRGGISDFALLKDIVERHIDAVEEDINLTLSIPLYLGLMGTMVGIVISLFGIGEQSKVADVLLKGVQMAMFVSAIGLFFTIFNSIKYRSAKAAIVANKNDLYTFIKTELLPVVNQSLAVSIESFQRGLIKFNGDLQANIDRLTGLFSNNFSYFEAFSKTIEKLDNLDIAKIAKFNIAVLTQLDKSIVHLEKFTEYLGQLNSFVAFSQQLVKEVNHLLHRTEHIETIAQKIESNLSDNAKLIHFLNSHFQDLKEREELIVHAVSSVDLALDTTMRKLEKHVQERVNLIISISDTENSTLKSSSEARTRLISETIIGIDQILEDALRQLEEHTQNVIKSVKEITINEQNSFVNNLASNQKSLNNLKYIADIKESLSLMKTESITKNEFEQLANTLKNSMAILEEMNNRSWSKRFSKLISLIKGTFAKNS